jgi:hypothetical protein
MLSVDEGVFQSEEMVVVILIELRVELHNNQLGPQKEQRVGPTRSRTDTSIILWLKYAVLFFTTLTATTSCVFKF